MADNSVLEKLFVNQLKNIPGHDTPDVRETFFTASLAGTLQSSIALRRRFVEILVGGRAWEGYRIGQADIDVTTEERHTSRGDACRFDLLLAINGTHKIAIEAKLDAPEGVDERGRRQVDRYLKLKSIDHVAYVTAAETEPSGYAKRQEKTGRYLVPRDKGQLVRWHFLWSDFYSAVRVLAQSPRPNPLVLALLGLLDNRRLQPQHKLVGHLGARVKHADLPDAVKKNRARIQTALEALRGQLPVGWELREVHRNGFAYLGGPASSDWTAALFTRDTPGNLRIRINVKSEAERIALEKRLSGVLAKELHGSFGRNFAPNVRVPKKSRHDAVDIYIPFRAILQGLRKNDRIADRLARVVNTTLLTARRVARRLPRWRFVVPALSPPDTSLARHKATVRHAPREESG